MTKPAMIAAIRMPVPVADSQFSVKTAASGVGFGDDRRHAHDQVVQPVRSGSGAIEMLLSKSLTCGSPHRKTSTLRITHGVHAWMICGA